MLTKIQMVYGFLPEEEKSWIENNLKYLNESEQENYMNILRQENPARRGQPTVQMLQKVLTKVTGKAPPVYYWAVCMECGCEYDFRMPKCPACYKKDLYCSTRAVKISKDKPHIEVIRYNKSCGDNNCYDCDKSEMSFCFHFGQTDWVCHNLSNCSCASCCIKEKKANQKIEENIKSGATFSYATPIKKKC